MISALLALALSAQDYPLLLRDEGANLGRVGTVNCVGAGVACTLSKGVWTLSVTGGGSGGSGLPADPAACPGGQFVYDQNASGVLQCSSVGWSVLTGVPSTFPPSAHTHPVSDIQAVGTEDATTFLRGDGAWAVPVGATNTGGSVLLVGNTSTGANLGNAAFTTGRSGNSKVASVFTLTARTTFDSVALYAGGTLPFRGFIYQTSGGVPTSLIAQTAIATTASGAAWNSAPFTAPLTLEPGTYAVGALFSLSGFTHYYTGSASNGVIGDTSDAWSDGVSASWGTPTYLVGTLSAYLHASTSPAVIIDSQATIVSGCIEEFRNGTVSKACVNQDGNFTGNAASSSTILPASTVTQFWRGDNTWGAPPFSAAMFIPGKPANGAIMARVALAEAVRVPASLTGSKFSIGTNPAASLTLLVKKNGTQFCTLVISTAGAFTPTTCTQTDFAAGDRLEVFNAATADTAAADFTVTILGSRL